ncbi:MAG: hypothetical protein QXQ50_04450 [Candidatus Bathyarchaeia archaeon]
MKLCVAVKVLVIFQLPSPLSLYVPAARSKPPVVISSGIDVQEALGVCVLVLKAIHLAGSVPGVLPSWFSIQFLPIVVNTPALPVKVPFLISIVVPSARFNTTSM